MIIHIENFTVCHHVKTGFILLPGRETAFVGFACSDLPKGVPILAKSPKNEGF